LIAGINAALRAQEREPFILDRASGLYRCPYRRSDD
jgi:tRNA U34 5-carboxymethylaminomethyl modifying enzyme MnmG/GidA